MGRVGLRDRQETRQGSGGLPSAQLPWSSVCPSHGAGREERQKGPPGSLRQGGRSGKMGGGAVVAPVLTIWCHWVVEKKVSCSLLPRNLEGCGGAAQQSLVLGRGVWHTLPAVPTRWGPPPDRGPPGVLTSTAC